MPPHTASAQAHANDPALEDRQVLAALDEELARQRNTIELIASENFTSPAVLAAQGSVLTNKYAEGYPARRYYGGCEAVDIAETIAIERACKLFGCGYANVQPHSGSQANQTAFLAFLKPGDAILGMSLAAGGHLTHGNAPNLSGTWFRSAFYGVGEDGFIDHDEVEAKAKETKPKMLIVGASAYARQIDFARFRTIADSVGATLMADVAHYAGLIATGLYPSPFPHAHVVTTTTHKTLRGPRGGLILSDDEETAKRIDKALFPGLQGGPLMHVVAAKAVAFGEALHPAFKAYIKQVLANAQALASTLDGRGFPIISGGTDTHLMLVDLRTKSLKGRDAERSLDRAGITCNKNTIPDDLENPFVTSGIRLGTPAGTTRGFGTKEFEIVGELIADVLEGLASNPDDNDNAEKDAMEQVRDLCERFPLYSGLRSSATS